MQAIEVGLAGMRGIRGLGGAYPGPSTFAAAGRQSSGFGVTGIGSQGTVRPCPGDPTRTYFATGSPAAMANQCSGVAPGGRVPAAMPPAASCCASCAGGGECKGDARNVLPWALGAAAVLLLLGAPGLALLVGLLVLAVPFLARLAGRG